jgi:hypothetical protein
MSLLMRKDVAPVSSMEVFPKASPGLQVLVATTSTTTSIPGPVVGKEWWKLDLEVAAAGIQLEAATTT